jgi:hypothetical protein
MSRMHSGYAALALLFGAASACGAESTDGEPTASATLAALNASISECKTQRDACEAAGQTPAGATDCRDAFRTCHGQAVDKAMPDLKQGASACASDARACRAAAHDSDAKRACNEELKQCVAENGHGKAASDGGTEHGNGEAVQLCITALRGCIEGDTDVKVCTEALRLCLSQSIDNEGQGRGHTDAGKPAKDDTRRKADAGTSHGHGKPQTSHAGTDCNAARKACVESGKSAMECAQAAKTCRADD